MSTASVCSSVCPRCGPGHEILITERPLPPSHAAEGMLHHTYQSCARCRQVLCTPETHVYDTDRSDDFAAPFAYDRSLVRVPGAWRRLTTIRPITDEVIDAIRASFVPRDNDIWLATYPKCGTTWVQNVLSHLIDESMVCPDRPVQVGLQLTDDMLWLDALCGIHGVEDMMQRVQAMPASKPRLFKSHAPLALLEPLVATNAKIVHVARNPKDVVVSFWHHSKAKNDAYEGDFNNFFDKLFIPGDVESGTYFDFVFPYCKATNRWSEASRLPAGSRPPYSQVTTLWYEDMTRAPEASIEKLADFLGISVTPARVEIIKDACSFESMKTAQLKHGTRLSNTLIEPDLESDGTKEKACKNHIRKGGIGGWREYLSEDQSKVIDDIFAEKSREHALELDLEWG